MVSVYWFQICQSLPTTCFTISQCTTKIFSNLHILCKLSAQRVRTRWVRLAWAPHSASTISVPSMTYSTPVPLAKVGQGVSFACSLLPFWVHLAQLKHPETVTLKCWRWLLAWNLDQRPPTLSIWPWVVSALLSCFWALAPTSRYQTSHHASGPSDHWPNCTSCLCISASFASRIKQLHFWHSLFISTTTYPACMEKAVAMAEQTCQPRVTGKGIGQAPERGLAPREDPPWIWPRTSSWACPTSSCWGSCTCNPHRTSLWLKAY